MDLVHAWLGLPNLDRKILLLNRDTLDTPARLRARSFSALLRCIAEVLSEKPVEYY